MELENEEHFQVSVLRGLLLPRVNSSQLDVMIEISYFGFVSCFLWWELWSANPWSWDPEQLGFCPNYMTLSHLSTFSAFSHSVCSGGLVAKSCPTLVTPWTVAPQAPRSVGFSRQEYCIGLPFPTPGDISDPGLNLPLLCLLHCRQIIYHWAMGWLI